MATAPGASISAGGRKRPCVGCRLARDCCSLRRRSVRRTLGLAPILGLFMLSHSTAAGQPSAPSAPPETAKDEAGGLIPPKLRQAPEVTYPDVEGERHPVSVLLAITIDAAGNVT